ncbi:ABC transporter permease [Paradesulfitobacterium ferrireducens]|uniref:ABC transporter permease n=1 Tax=Paradesulfitobacterium ferrireducens TaxID=2816476 RepID=UPI001F48802D|nr:ABC transporter permease [Paradesulfitobacterium ferrireducens]
MDKMNSSQVLLNNGNNLNLISLKLFLRNQIAFFSELKGHPSALIGFIILILYILMAILAPLIAPHSPTTTDLDNRLLPPFWLEGGKSTFLLGTDVLGMDLLSRIIYGAQISLIVGFLAVGISILIGGTLGMIAGYYRGIFDQIISRLADLLLAFPFLIFAIGMMAFMGPGFLNLILALTFKGWVEFFRLVRGEVMSEKTKEYVEAANALGISKLKIMVVEILPNIIHSITVLGTLRLGYMIIMEASLSFLGLGIQPPTPAWGSMINDGRDYVMNAWWISTLPGIALLILVLSINLFGEGLRDLTDPRLKRS